MLYYFIGIKGSGMSSLAQIMHELGYNVTGSDKPDHFFTEVGLIEKGIKFYEFNPDNIKEGMTIVKGNAFNDDFPEVQKAKELNLKIYTYQEMIDQITKETKLIAVSGCHGKTTTTTMVAKLFENLGINYLIGDGTGHAIKGNEYFALEACEYKRHFLAYNPYYTIILNIDLDHVDYFKDINDVIDAYQEFANLSNKMIIANGDDENVRKLVVNKKIVYFGLQEKNDIRAVNISYTKDGTIFDVIIEDVMYGHFDLPIYGEHQLMDSLAVIGLCYYEGIDSEIVLDSFKTFSGAKRRFTETFVSNNVIIDDYAHHPNEVHSTINAIKQKYSDKLVVAIFQPHTFSRTKEFAEDLANELSKVDYAYVLDIHPAREKQEEYLGVTKDIIVSKKDNIYALSLDEADILNKYDNAVFIFMSPNDISKLEQDLINLKRTEK